MSEQSSTQSPDATAAATESPGTILIVDDVQSNRTVIRLLLRPEGYTFLEAANGEECLEILRSQAADLVILDLMMPVRDGFSVLEEMQGDDALKNIPVIVASALSESEYVERGLQLGAIDYLLKPLAEDVRKFQLVLKARNLVNLKRLRDKLKDMNEELIIKERDRAVLEMAGAANHEINQPLTVIMGRLELLLRRDSKEIPSSSELQTIYDQALRIANIVKKIGKMTHYETKAYVGDSQIVDFDASSSPES